MSDSPTSQLQCLLDRMRQGDDSARKELIACTYERLRVLASKTLHRNFPRLQNLHGTESVLHGSAIRLLQALQEVQLPTVCDFFNFAAAQMRRVLLDMARQADRGGPGVNIGATVGRDSSQGAELYEPADGTGDPAKMAMWTEFHEKVNALPERERQVVDLYFYQGLTQEETAKILGISQKEVSRLWITATRRLPDCVP